MALSRIVSGHILVFLAASLGASYGQNEEIDSLLQRCEQFEIVAPDSALACYQNTLALSEKEGYKFGAAQSKLRLGLVHSDIGKYAEGLDYLQDARDDFLRIENVQGEASALINTGSIYFKLGAGDEATGYFLEAIEILKEDSQHRTILFMAYANLANNLGMMENLERALHYNRHARSLALELQDTLRMSFIWNNAGVLHKRLDFPDSARFAYQQAIRIGERYNLPEVLQTSYQNLSEILLEEGSFAESLQYAKMSLQHAETWGDPFYLHPQQASTATAYYKNGYSDSAAVLFADALRGAEVLGSYGVLEQVYYHLSDFLEATGKPGEALAYYKKAKQYSDSISGDDRDQYVSLLETRFRTAQKEETIARQELELARQNLFLSISLAGGVGLLMILALVTRNFQHRKKLNLQNLEKLRQENEIAQLRALMAGEERERARIGHDLHDSVGGMIGSVQLYLTGNSQNGNLKKAREIVSATANEIRRISHNLMPEILLREGLQNAVARFCDNLSSSGKLKVETAFVNGPFIDLDDDRQLIVFRAIQELVHNALKHAQATEIFVQVSQDQKELNISVEDNGQGLRSGNKQGGTGLNNLSERLDKLGGHLELQSTEEGVSVNISIPLKKQSA